MANLGTIKTITLANGDIATFNVPYYTGTGTAGQAGSSSKAYIPALWTFNTGYTPVVGDVIIIKIPVAGISSGVWLSVDNGTTYYPVALYNKVRLTTHYSVNYLLMLVYEANATTTTYGTDKTGAPKGATAADLVSNRWTVVNGYDSNTTYSAMTVANMTAGTETTARLMTAANMKSGLQSILAVSNGDVQLYGNHITGQVPAATANDEGKILEVVNGEWSADGTNVIRKGCTWGDLLGT
jgi:hypothetical protein